jgi:hypothetical protein
MKIFAVLLFVACAHLALSEDKVSDVVVLTAANFDESTAEGKWLVELYVTLFRCCFLRRFIAATLLGAATARNLLPFTRLLPLN